MSKEINNTVDTILEIDEISTKRETLMLDLTKKQGFNIFGENFSYSNEYDDYYGSLIQDEKHRIYINYSNKTVTVKSRLYKSLSSKKEHYKRVHYEIHDTLKLLTDYIDFPIKDNLKRIIVAKYGKREEIGFFKMNEYMKHMTTESVQKQIERAEGTLKEEYEAEEAYEDARVEYYKFAHVVSTKLKDFTDNGYSIITNFYSL